MAVQAEHLKSAKYAALKASHHFVPFAVETSGVLGQAALSLVLLLCISFSSVRVCVGGGGGMHAAAEFGIILIQTLKVTT